MRVHSIRTAAQPNWRWDHSIAGYLIVVACLLANLISAACSPPRPDEDRYLDQLITDREIKDREFSGVNSIVPLDRQAWMVPLSYYEPDPSYRVPAQLAIGDEQPIFEIPTSTGQFRTVQRVGTLQFVLKGESMNLAALVELPVENSGQLFVPFVAVACEDLVGEPLSRDDRDEEKHRV